MSATFASKADMTAKKITFTKLSDNAYAYTAEGDPNSGVIIGDDCCMVIDTTATPVMAQDLIARIREVTDKPIKYVMLTHYHAVRVLGASAYFKEGAQAVIASHGHLRADRRARRGGHEERDRALSRASSRTVESIPGPDLAGDHLRPANDAVPGQARGRADAHRPGAHPRRRHRLDPVAEDLLLRRPGRIQRRRLHRRRATRGMAGDPGGAARPGRRRSSCPVAARRWRIRPTSTRASTTPRSGSPTCTRPPRPVSPRARP